MKKGLNNIPVSRKKDFSLPKANILRGRKNIQRLFESDATVFREQYVKLRFRLYPDASNQYLMGFIVKKSLGKAVYRNRIKRRLREAYRLNQHTLSDAVKASPFSFHGVLMAKTIDISLEQAEQNITDLLHKIQKHILSLTGSDS